jgi:fatty-acyl-CoA synthase
MNTMKQGNTSHSAHLTESYWPADKSESVLDVTLGQLLREVAAEVPDCVALVEGRPDASSRRRWTYAQLLAEAERVASALLARFQPGERIAVWAPNIPEWELLQLGASLAGMVLVTVNPAFKAQELTYVLRQSRALGLFYLEEYRGNNMTAILSQARADLSDLREVVGFAGWQDFVESASPSAQLPDVRPDDAVQIQYTSGTTGFPKGAILHHSGIVNASRFMAEGTGLERGGVWVNAMPMFHIGGCGLAAVGTLARRGKHVLVPGFDAALVLELIESEQGTFMLAVPTMLTMLLDHPDRARRNLSTLRTIISGASMIPAALVRRVQKELDCQFSIVFGQTELHGIITHTHRDDTPEDQSETIGQPMAQVEVKIVDIDTNQVLPIGEQGEICARGYQTMLGYFDMPEATSATLEPEGWLHTGDLGTMDERGYLRITGRLKDMIIRGGENIYPREIEALLSEHPRVANAVIIGVPDEKWGEQVAAVIQLVSSEEPPSPAELHDYCRAHLAAYKTPKLWSFVDQFPLTATGKIQKFVLRERVGKGELVPIRVERATEGIS